MSKAKEPNETPSPFTDLIAATESKLRNSHGCSFVNLYGNLTTGCRALLTWSYVDKNGIKDSGQSHPSIQ